MTGGIFSVERFSVHDGPGVRTSVFFMGCPLHCIWCHNPESHTGQPVLQYLERECADCMTCADTCPEGVHSFPGGRHRIERGRCVVCGRCSLVCPMGALSILGRTCTADEVLAEICKDAPYYGDEGGVTLSGGEPLLQPDFAADILRGCKERGFSTCVETAGAVPPQAFLKVMGYTDLFLYDYKLDTQEQMDLYTGGCFKTVVDNLELLVRHQRKVVLRCPVIPGINDTSDHLKRIAELADRFAIEDVQLMPYHGYGEDKWRQTGREYRLAGLANMDKETAECCRQKLKECREKVKDRSDYDCEV